MIRNQDHETYSVWRRLRNRPVGSVVPAWDTFAGFLADMAPRPGYIHESGTPSHVLVVDEEPAGPDTARWCPRNSTPWLEAPQQLCDNSSGTGPHLMGGHNVIVRSPGDKSRTQQCRPCRNANRATKAAQRRGAS